MFSAPAAVLLRLFKLFYFDFSGKEELPVWCLCDQTLKEKFPLIRYLIDGVLNGTGDKDKLPTDFAGSHLGNTAILFTPPRLFQKMSPFWASGSLLITCR